MSWITYPVKRWRKDRDGYHRLIGSGPGCLPGVLASVTQSTAPAHHGQFWWGVTAKIHGYEPTFERAKTEAEWAVTKLEK